MMRTIKTVIQKTANAFGVEVVKLNSPPPPHYLKSDPAYADIIRAVEPYTMTSCERISAVVDAARYIARRGIPGAVVECGVWRGGSTMSAALALQQAGDLRDLYLFDTFGGMTAPTPEDFDFRGDHAQGLFDESDAGDHNEWCYASLEDVQRNLLSTGYPAEKCHFIKGDVMKTLPTAEPRQIALLRLDTDFYDSTAHEMAHLYDRLSPGGVMIVDDYGHWQGCQKAVDEYFGDKLPLLSRIDYTGRMMVKSF